MRERGEDTHMNWERVHGGGEGAHARVVCTQLSAACSPVSRENVYELLAANLLSAMLCLTPALLAIAPSDRLLVETTSFNFTLDAGASRSKQLAAETWKASVEIRRAVFVTFAVLSGVAFSIMSLRVRREFGWRLFMLYGTDELKKKLYPKLMLFWALWKAPSNPDTTSPPRPPPQPTSPWPATALSLSRRPTQLAPLAPPLATPPYADRHDVGHPHSRRDVGLSVRRQGVGDLRAVRRGGRGALKRRVRSGGRCRCHDRAEAAHLQHALTRCRAGTVYHVAPSASASACAATCHPRSSTPRSTSTRTCYRNARCACGTTLAHRPQLFPATATANVPHLHHGRRLPSSLHV